MLALESVAPDAAIEAEIARIRGLHIDELRSLWRKTFRATAPRALTRDLLGRMIAYRIQERAYGGLDRATLKLLERYARGQAPQRIGARRLQAGTVLLREYRGERYTVTVTAEGFLWREQTYLSLSAIARAITGTSWNGPRFFGVRAPGEGDEPAAMGGAKASTRNKNQGVDRVAAQQEALR